MKAHLPEARGFLVAIGGAEDKTSELQILRRVFSLAPGDRHVVGVLTTASGIPDEVFPVYHDAFRRLGASEVHHLNVRNREQAGTEENVATVGRCGTIFLSGGDQLRLTNTLGGSPLLQAIRQRYAEGAVVAGTSAGAAAMSATMIYNGAASDALRKGSVNMSSGLAFIEGVVIDSHFLERGRFSRLMEVGATNPEYIGIGLGEDAGVIVHDGRILEAIGSGHVIVVDSSGLRSSNVAEISDGEPVAVEHVVMHALISGYGYHVEERRFLHPEELNKTISGEELAHPGGTSS
jgi:cyanophycinase